MFILKVLNHLQEKPILTKEFGDMKLKTSMIRVDKVIAIGGSYDEVESKIGMEEVDQDIKIY